MSSAVTAVVPARLLSRGRASYLFVMAVTGGALMGTITLGIGVSPAMATGAALMFLALAGGVLSNWSP